MLGGAVIASLGTRFNYFVIWEKLAAITHRYSERSALGDHYIDL